MDSLHKLLPLACPKCGGKTTAVIYVEENIRRGWYCPPCKHFEKAVGRERILESTADHS